MGSLIQKRFPSKQGKGFAPVLPLDESNLVVAIAHVARHRVTKDPGTDMFSPFDPRIGDVGNELAETVVEWVRFSSCGMMLDGLQRELNEELRARVRQYNETYCSKRLGYPPPYDLYDPKLWNSKDKKAHTVSVLFQVRFIFARVYATRLP